ncbi:hypothetical protein EES40_36460 [Streptomyces sp. ADI93-02]|nr:hypothetical protein EES40_36460 [Streptomyces sp. ADI93-02]
MPRRDDKSRELPPWAGGGFDRPRANPRLGPCEPRTRRDALAVLHYIARRQSSRTPFVVLVQRALRIFHISRISVDHSHSFLPKRSPARHPHDSFKDNRVLFRVGGGHAKLPESAVPASGRPFWAWPTACRCSVRAGGHRGTVSRDQPPPCLAGCRSRTEPGAHAHRRPDRPRRGRALSVREPAARWRPHRRPRFPGPGRTEAPAGAPRCEGKVACLSGPTRFRYAARRWSTAGARVRSEGRRREAPHPAAGGGPPRRDC